ncbi:MAG: 1-acyl-sn-glycerol-3-phosphate acyltransferase [Chloroflexota bacterium]|nr:MAG: 1-acyl-sn-glycerol-3-phosphate acyltransferase [Chloroflexota bacterium]
MAERVGKPQALYPKRFWQVVPGVRFFSFYTFAVVVIRFLLKTIVRFELRGIENVPVAGPIMIVSNHINIADPPIIGGTLGRKVLFMAKEELFTVPVMGWIVANFDAFPVKRGAADRQALRNAELAASLGIAVGMFPEGTRSRDGVMKRAFPGAAMVALRANCPIVPVGIDGSEHLFSSLRRGRRATVKVTYGQPFRLETPSEGAGRLDRLTDTMMRRVADLLPEWRRGPYQSDPLSVAE